MTHGKFSSRWFNTKPHAYQSSKQKVGLAQNLLMASM
jgi:hypothetical protein